LLSAGHFRSAPMSGHTKCPSGCLKRASSDIIGARWSPKGKFETKADSVHFEA
jgi:hypothetical protein